MPEHFTQAVREAMKVIPIRGKTNVTIAVVNKKDNSFNTQKIIPCNQGEPLSKGYVYEASSDSYRFNCAEFKEVGPVPCGYKLELEHSGGWSVRIPIPKQLLEELFTSSQKKLYAYMCEKYDALSERSDYELHFLQTVNCFE